MVMINQIDIQTHFEELLRTKFPHLQPIGKLRQTMWHIEGNLVVSLVHLSKKTKFCFFNNANLALDKIQRWGSTIYSHNLEYTDENEVNWDEVSEFIQNTIDVQK